MEFLNNFDQYFNFRFYLIVMFFVLKYVFCALGSFILMKRRSLKCKFLAFFPVLNSSYCIGSISDSINKNYLHETFARFGLLMLSIIKFIVAFFVVYVFMFYSNESREVFLDILFERKDPINEFFEIVSNSLLIRSVLICSLVLYLLYFVYLFRVYYNIFNEYGGNFSRLALFLSVIISLFIKFSLVADLFLYAFSNKRSKFEKLNTVK